MRKPPCRPSLSARHRQLQNIADTYMLNRVKLSDGREGDIVFINKQRLSKPMVKCGDEFVDLTKVPDVYISAIL